MGWVQTRYRPYRWGNRVAIGVLVGQVLGMAHSPLAFPASVPAMVQTAMARVAVASGAIEQDQRAGELELSIGEAAGPVTSAAGDGRSSAATTGPGPATSDGAGTGSSAASATSGGPRTDTTAGGSGGSTVVTGSGGSSPPTGGASTSSAPPIGTTTGDGPGTSTPDAGPPTTRRSNPTSTTRPVTPTTPSSTAPPTTAPSTTAPSTTSPDDLGGVTGPDPCARPATSVATWLVTVLAGDEELVRLRRDVVAAATDIPADAFAAAGPSTWRVEGTAGALCTASKLVEVVAVNPLP